MQILHLFTNFGKINIMTESVITKADFAALTRTAAINLSDEEAEQLRMEMNRQMGIIRQLESIPLEEGLAPVIHGNPYPEEIRCELRVDEIHPFDNAARILTQAPRSKDGYFVSPDVPHQRIG